MQSPHIHSVEKRRGYSLIIALAVLVIILFLALLPLIIFSTVHVTVTIEHSALVEELKIQIQALFGLFIYSTTIPINDLLEGGEEVVKEKAEEKRISWDLKEVKNLLKKTISARKSAVFFLKKTRVKTIQWETNFGMENAANTAVGAELLLNLKVAILSLLSHHSNFLTVPQLIVTPIYEMKTVQTYLKCMITFKLGHAMIAVIKLMKSQKKLQET